jgi:hypothetical protein
MKDDEFEMAIRSCLPSLLNYYQHPILAEKLAQFDEEMNACKGCEEKRMSALDAFLDTLQSSNMSDINIYFKDIINVQQTAICDYHASIPIASYNHSTKTIRFLE